jgi:replicative superfamily II helicase
VLIFVHSRKETAKTARHLKDTALANEHLARFMRDDSASREILQVGGWVLGWVGWADVCGVEGVAV